MRKYQISVNPFTYVQPGSVSRQVQVGLVWEALGFPAAELGQGSVGFAKS